MENKIVCKKIKNSIPQLKLDSKVKMEPTEKKDPKVKEDLLDLKELMVLLSLKISFLI
jgi:hypothetical protein